MLRCLLLDRYRKTYTGDIGVNYVENKHSPGSSKVVNTGLYGLQLELTIEFIRFCNSPVEDEVKC